MAQVKPIWSILLSFILGYLLGEYRESLYLALVLKNISNHEAIPPSNISPIKIVPEPIRQEPIKCPACSTCAPIPEKKVQPLYDQRCMNKKTGWSSLKTHILQNNTIYNSVKDYKGELDISTWGEGFVKYINELLPEVAASSTSDHIIVIEVGSWKGKSTYDHATKCREMAKKFNKECVVISVDTWLGSMEHYESEDPKMEPVKYAQQYATDLFLKFLNNMKLKNATDIVYPIRLPSSTAAHVLHCFKIEADMILIDADHDYTPVLRDIELFYPLVRKGGVFYGHDYGWEGVHRAVNEYKKLKKNKIKFWVDGVCWFMKKNEEETEFFNKF